jgi:arabinogalactan oligomer/maltooligosaccharide transport system substrate-binding protein
MSKVFQGGIEMKKSIFLALNVALVAAFALAACSPAATPAPTTVPVQPTTAPVATTAAATEAPTTAAATVAPTTAAATVAPTSAPAATKAGATGTVTLWHSYHAGGTEEQAINQLVAQYQKDNPGVTVNVQEIPFAQIFAKFKTDVASGGASADMFTAPNDDLGNWVRAGLVAPLDKQLAGKLDGVSKTGVDGVTVDGKIYAVPGIIKAVALYYNKSTITTPPATTADLLSLLKSGKKIVLNENNYHNYGFFPAFGGQLTDSTGKCIADQGGYADAMQYLLDLKAAGAQFQTDGGKADTLFQTSAVDMIIDGPWVLGDMKKALGDKLGVAPIPAGPKGPAMPLAGIDGFYLNPNSQNTDAAIALAQYIFSAKGLATYADVAGDPPARTDVTVSDPLVKAFADAAAAGTPRPQSVEFGNWWGPFGDMVTKVIEGKSTPADGVKAACDAMNKANKK